MSEKPRTINHFSHDHHLKFHKKHSVWTGQKKCWVCGRGDLEIPGPIYGCTHCVFFIHLFCAEFPEQLRHPFHPQHLLSFTKSLLRENGERPYCNACDRYILNASAYRCIDCNFSLHLNCSKLQPLKISTEAQLKHLEKHEHPLFICREYPSPVSHRECSICEGRFLNNQLIIVCLVCRKLLHESCVLPLEIRHPFHLKHPMAFFRSDSSISHNYCCGACGDSLYPGRGYRCSDCHFYLHLRCANLEPTSEHEPLRHTYCGHHLIECKINMMFKCRGCGRINEDFIYVCLNCRWSLCKSCSESLPKITHPFHPLHLLKLDWGYAPRECNACEVNYGGKLTYECSSNDKCRFRLHPFCAAVKPRAIVKIKDHEHPIALITSKLSKLSELKCGTCGRLCEDYFFRCFECYYTIHLKCYASLPRAIKHDCHCDPLMLTYSKIKVESDEDSDEEFYCNACEEIRALEDPAYYCEDCYFVAHVHCVWSSIQQVFETEPMAPSQASSNTSQSLVTTKKIRTTSQKSRIINHFRHHHTLKLHKKHSGWTRQEQCLVCGEGVFGNGEPIYGCTECVVFIHLICAELPERLCHPFHSQHFLSFTETSKITGESAFSFIYCNACGVLVSYISYSVYHCIECNFSLHLNCSKLQPLKLIEAQQQYLGKHEHQLFICRDPSPGSYRQCSFCDRSFLDNEFIIVCLVCRKLSHESCVLPQEIRHPFHLEHPMVFFRFSIFPGLHYPCEACGVSPIKAGYYCSDCGFFLDHRCANLEPTSEHEPLKHAYCDNQLIECKNQKYKSDCVVCGRTIEDFMCVCLKCRLLLCKPCSELLPEITHPFHPLHHLKLVSQYFRGREKKCNACDVEFRGKLTYECPNNKCSFSLDPFCAATKPHAIIKIIDHEHPVALITSMLRKESKLECGTCRRLCEGYFFRCFECYYTIHLKCYASLPRAIKHDCHCDPLVLTHSKIKVEIDEDSDEEFYCNACEELRDLEDPAYYCEDCYFVAHIHCVWSSILQSLEAESTAPSVPSFSQTKSLPLSSEATQSIERSQSLPSSSELPPLLPSSEQSQYLSPSSKPNESLPSSTRAGPFPPSIEPSVCLPSSNEPSALVPSPGLSQSLPPSSNELAPFEPSSQQPQAISTAFEPGKSLSSSQLITSLPLSSEAPQTPLVPSHSVPSSYEPTEPLPLSSLVPSASPSRESSSLTMCFCPLRKKLLQRMRRCLKK